MNRCLILGDIFLDINIKLDNDILYGDITQCKKFSYNFGGAYNIAYTLNILGVNPILVGKVGNDIFGRIFRELINDQNIENYIFEDRDNPTGILISIIDSSGERSFITARGANDNLTIDEISVINKLEYGYLYVSGYSFRDSTQRSSYLYAMELSKDSTIIFDPASYDVINNNRSVILKALELTDILSCNEKEAICLTNTNNINNSALILSEMVPLVIIRLGSKGCMICSNKEIKYIPTQKVQSIDTTGAGDAFTSALIYGISNNWGIEKSAYFANIFAAMKTTKLGSISLPTKDEIKEMINKTCDLYG